MPIENDNPEKQKKTILIFGSVMVTIEPNEPKKEIELIKLSASPSDQAKDFIGAPAEPEIPLSE